MERMQTPVEFFADVVADNNYGEPGHGDLVYCVASPPTSVRPLFAPGCVAPPLNTPGIASSVRLAGNEHDLEPVLQDLRRSTLVADICLARGRGHACGRDIFCT